MDAVSARQPVLAVSVDRERLAAGAVGVAHCRDRLAGPPPRGLSHDTRGEDMTALTVPARPAENASLRPVPWRRMAWVTWRQHRLALTGVAVFLSALAVILWRVGLGLHHAYAAATACRPASSVACNDLATRFARMDDFMANGSVLQAVPAVIGAF